MAKKIALTVDERKTRDELAARSTIESKKLDDAISAYVNAVTEAHRSLAEAVDSYNEAMADVRDFVDTTASRLRDEMSKRSAAWLDSPRGAAAEDFVSAIEAVNAGDFGVDDPPEIEPPEDPSDALNNIADEPEE